jgi:hypothetical protein
VKAQSTVVDPSDVREAVLLGIASIERGDCIELRGDAELKEFFDDIVNRGKKRAAAKKRKAARVCFEISDRQRRRCVGVQKWTPEKTP